MMNPMDNPKVAEDNYKALVQVYHPDKYANQSNLVKSLVAQNMVRLNLAIQEYRRFH